MAGLMKKWRPGNQPAPNVTQLNKLVLEIFLGNLKNAGEGVGVGSIDGEINDKLAHQGLQHT